MRKWFGIAHFKVKTYFLWVLIEIALVSTIYVILFDREPGGFILDYIYSLQYTILGMLIPYIFSLFIIHNRYQRFEIKNLSKNIVKGYNDLINFKEENQNVKFSIINADLLFLEATDNYVSIYYLNNGDVKRSLIRNTLKALELEQLPENIIRCHRSYMVNLKHIEYVKKNNRSFQIKLKNYDQLLQVSQKYKPAFLEILN
ncbi:MAG: LytTR family DNA-binding domain-containing protein [Bacteroidales bacterium]|nr:LytTR family DNA-binding domain-containing protein [Bacteroidales bacterium]